MLLNFFADKSKSKNVSVSRMPTQAKCFAKQCVDTGSEQKVVTCALCGYWYHYKCSGIDENVAEIAKMFEKSKFVKYHCVNCVDQKLSDVVRIVSEKIYANLSKKILDGNTLIKELSRKFSEQNMNDDVVGKLNDISEKMEPWNVVVGKKKSKNAPSVVIKPKDVNTKRDEIRKVLCEKMDSAEYGFVDARMSSKNGIIISCNNKEKQEEFASKAVQVLGDKFDVKCNKELMPRMKIVSVIVENDVAASLENVEQLLSDRNDVLKNAVHAKVVHMFPRKKFESQTEKCIDVVMEVDKVTYKYYVEAGNRVKLDWMSCPVYDGIYIKRCSKCLGFGHNKEVCKRETCCTKCGGGHLRKDCTNADDRCVNCLRVNSVAKKEVYKINHSANSTECPTLVQHKDRMRSMINLD